jgi:FkbM family methyltransferase
MKSCYERSLFGFKILPSDYWLDLGAHIGVFTSMALSAGAKVVAVEPEPCNFDLLSQNAESNNKKKGLGDDPRCILIQAAVVEAAQHTPSATLYLHSAIGFRHSVIAKRRRVPWATCSVPATTLTALLDAHPNVSAVKVDIQVTNHPLLIGYNECKLLLF